MLPFGRNGSLLWIFAETQYGVSCIVATPANRVVYTRPMPKRTYQPKKRQRSAEHGFLKRMATKAGRTVLHRRRLKGRASLSK